ncbi:MAG TPA: hypothetical protein DCK87_04710, partial [Desulfotomaculum sp.]|nr:hypothetical protein [Desulfotomaculum sp.]
ERTGRACTGGTGQLEHRGQPDPRLQLESRERRRSHLRPANRHQPVLWQQHPGGGWARPIKIEDHNLKAVGAGTTGLTAYSKNRDTDWIYQGTIEVVVCPSGGGGGGAAPSPGVGSVGPKGGKVTGAAGKACVEIPAGVLDKEVVITIKQVVLTEVTAPPATLKLASDIYEFGPAGTKFAKPVTITLQYDPAKLAGAKEEMLAVYYLDETTKTWVSLGGTVDKTKHTVTVEVDHFSKYAVMVETVVKPPACVFSDLTKEHWAYECIITLCAKGIVAGYPDQTFRPGRNVTRAEFTKLLTGALGLAKETPEVLTFKDVKPVNWHYEWVEAAAKAGLIKGYKGEFRPNDQITRQEMVAIMIRAAGKESEALAKAQEKIDLADEAQISSWARGYVALAVESGLIEGYPDKTFGPMKNTTRAEAAVIICRFKKY